MSRRPTMFDPIVSPTLIIIFYLFVKFWITALIQGTISGKAGDRVAEDLKNKDTDTEAADDAKRYVSESHVHSDILRWRLIVGNDVENLPLASVLVREFSLLEALIPLLVSTDLLGRSLCSPNSSLWSQRLHSPCTSAYCSIRCFRSCKNSPHWYFFILESWADHSVCFAFQLQPWRSICYMLALTCEFGYVINALVDSGASPTFNITA